MTESDAIKEFKERLAIEDYKKDIPEYYEAMETAVSSLEEIQPYRALGTVEELREATERQRAKKPKINKVDKDTIYMKCPNCKLTTVLYRGMQPDFCPKCGQAIDWSEEE